MLFFNEIKTCGSLMINSSCITPKKKKRNTKLTFLCAALHPIQHSSRRQRRHNWRHHCSAPHDGTAAALPPPRVASLRRLSHQAAVSIMFDLWILNQFKVWFEFFIMLPLWSWFLNLKFLMLHHYSYLLLFYFVHNVFCCIGYVL